jgi:hypothetical protein
MASIGLRTEARVAGLMVMPAVGYSVGGVQAGPGRAHIGGWRLVLGARWP